MMISKLNKLYSALIAVAVIAVAGVVIWLGHGLGKSSLTVDTDDSIEDTPLQIESMRAIGQWEFLAVSDEEMVDTVRKGVFIDDKLARIYYGTLRLGVDMQKLSDDAFRRQGDSITVMMPEIQLLDEEFIDETRTKAFFESGKWTPADRGDLTRRAYRLMKQHCLTRENIAAAQANAESQMRQMMRTLGYEHVKIVFQ